MTTRDDVKIFRPAILPMFLAMVAIGLPFGFCVIVLKFGFKGIPTFFSGAIYAAMAVWIYAWVMSRYLTLKLTPAGLHGHSFWGTRCFMLWEEIAKAKPIRFVNLQYLRLYRADGGSPLWLILFVARRAEFEQELRRLAPPGSPVVGYFSGG